MTWGAVDGCGPWAVSSIVGQYLRSGASGEVQAPRETKIAFSIDKLIKILLEFVKQETRVFGNVHKLRDQVRSRIPLLSGHFV